MYIKTICIYFERNMSNSTSFSSRSDTRWNEKVVSFWKINQTDGLVEVGFCFSRLPSVYFVEFVDNRFGENFWIDEYDSFKFRDDTSIPLLSYSHWGIKSDSREYFSSKTFFFISFWVDGKNPIDQICVTLQSIQRSFPQLYLKSSLNTLKDWKS